MCVGWTSGAAEAAASLPAEITEIDVLLVAALRLRARAAPPMYGAAWLRAGSRVEREGRRGKQGTGKVREESK